MAFTAEQKRALRAKRKQQREADDALRGVKRRPRGPPVRGHKWNDVAGKWFPTEWYEPQGPDDCLAIVIAKRRAQLQPDSPDYPVYAQRQPDGTCVIETTWENMEQRGFVRQRGSFPMVRDCVNRAAAEAWLSSKVDSPDHPVYAVLAPDGTGVIEATWENIEPYARQRDAIVQSCVNRVAAEAWLAFKCKSTTGAPSGSPRPRPGSKLATERAHAMRAGTPSCA